MFYTTSLVENAKWLWKPCQAVSGMTSLSFFIACELYNIRFLISMMRPYEHTNSCIRQWTARYGWCDGWLSAMEDGGYIASADSFIYIPNWLHTPAAVVAVWNRSIWSLKWIQCKYMPPIASLNWMSPRFHCYYRLLMMHIYPLISLLLGIFCVYSMISS